MSMYRLLLPKCRYSAERGLLIRNLVLVLSVFVVGGYGFAAAQDGEGGASPPPIIDSVEITAENVFDLSDPANNNFLFRLANNTHFVTRHAVIRRELLLGKGDVYDTALVNESVRNLRQLPYLLKSEIVLKKGAAGENIMSVTTSDKWTTTGGVSFHRSGGRSDVQVGIEENNLLGYGMFTSHDFFILEEDRNFYQMRLGDNRFLGRNVSVSFFYSDNPRAGQLSISASKPYYSLSQRWGGGIVYSNIKQRTDWYLSETLSAQDREEYTRLHLESTYRHGGKHLKYHFTIDYVYTDLTQQGRKFVVDSVLYDGGYLTADEIDTRLPPPSEDSILHFAQATVRLQQIRYATFLHLNRFHKPEDFNLGFDGRVSYGTARYSDLAGTPYSFVAVQPQYTARLGTSLATAGLRQEWWFSADGVIHRRLSAYLKGYWQYHRRQTLVLGARFQSDRLTSSALMLYLDEGNGMRGYPAYAYSGEERLVINIENRIFSDIEILTVGLGGVVFADIGNIWTRDTGMELAKTRFAIGLGLRFGVSRSTQAEIIRLDVGYAQALRNWQISVETGQYF